MKASRATRQNDPTRAKYSTLALVRNATQQKKQGKVQELAYRCSRPRNGRGMLGRDGYGSHKIEEAHCANQVWGGWPTERSWVRSLMCTEGS